MCCRRVRPATPTGLCCAGRGRGHGGSAVLCPLSDHHHADDGNQDEIGDRDPGQQRVASDEVDDPDNQTGSSQPEMREDADRGKVGSAPSTLRKPPRVAQRISMKNPNPAG